MALRLVTVHPNPGLRDKTARARRRDVSGGRKREEEKGSDRGECQRPRGAGTEGSGGGGLECPGDVDGSQKEEEDEGGGGVCEEEVLGCGAAE